ncbi:MAG: decarboxylating NADP(+)-dependent phosphogluconate dehydrogenase [Chloroflexota bacterium]
MSNCDLGLIGLAVMGQNLVLNMERNGYRVAVFNRSPDRTRQFMAGAAAGKQVFPYEDIPSFIGSLKSPRRVMLMVKAGDAVDQVIHEIKPYLQAGDLIIDGGNSFYRDTERRAKEFESDGLYYLGVGISGGEEGALHGPSIMPSGSPPAYALMEPVFEAISAKVHGEPCVTYLGPGGAGHFVKMVHNGIEYGDMQLIAEAYDILRRGLNLSAQELKSTFADWNRGPLSSYLIEITADIFGVIDPQSKQPLVEVILDEAEQKGTGKWTGQEALELGVPIPTLNAAVEARFLSALRHERLAAAPLFSGPPAFAQPEKTYWITAIEGALYASKICSYAQGMAMLSAASREYGYNFNLSEIARIWRGGCIIRARFLDDVRQAFRQQPDLPNLMLAEFFRNALARMQPAWREVVSFAVERGIPLPAMSASLAYYDSYRSERLPANLIQAQRDYFGAHTYRRLDQPGVFHTDWQK